MLLLVLCGAQPLCSLWFKIFNAKRTKNVKDFAPQRKKRAQREENIEAAAPKRKHLDIIADTIFSSVQRSTLCSGWFKRFYLLATTIHCF